MANKSYNKDKQVKLNNGKNYTLKRVNDAAYTFHKKNGRLDAWQNFRKTGSVEDLLNDRDLARKVKNEQGIWLVQPGNYSNGNEVFLASKAVSKTSKTSSMKQLNIQMGPVRGADFKLTLFGSVAVKTSNGYVAYNTEEEELTSVDGFTMDFEGAFYRMPSTTVAAGDLIDSDGKVAYVIEVKSKSIKVLDLETSEVKTIKPVKSPFGINFYTKITSMMDLMGGNTGSGLGDIFGGDTNPLMLMAMMNGGASGGNMFGGDMMQMMMMSQMMGGANPFTSKKKK